MSVVGRADDLYADSLREFDLDGVSRGQLAVLYAIAGYLDEIGTDWVADLREIVEILRKIESYVDAKGAPSN